MACAGNHLVRVTKMLHHPLHGTCLYVKGMVSVLGMCGTGDLSACAVILSCRCRVRILHVSLAWPNMCIFINVIFINVTRCTVSSLVDSQAVGTHTHASTASFLAQHSDE